MQDRIKEQRGPDRQPGRTAGREENIDGEFGLENHEARILVALARGTAHSVGELERLVSARQEKLRHALKSLSHAGFVFAQSDWSGSPEPIYALTENGAVFSKQVATAMSL